MLTISELYIYPIKSLGGISTTTAVVTDRGLQYDRRWMLVDENGIFLSQRQHPQMALLSVSIQNDGLKVQSKNANGTPLFIPFELEEQTSKTVKVWSDCCKAVYVNNESDEWFSDHLLMHCRLVYMPESTRRRVDGRYAKNKEITSFSDGYPIMMIGQASLDDLNNRLQQPLPMNRFRPNIVFTGGLPYEEDIMEHFDIASIEFFGVKRCARCVMTTINQDTSEKGKEPLKTLATYRMRNNKIYFGQNLVHHGKGVIKIGDTLNIRKHN